MTFVQRSKKIPPFLARLLARSTKAGPAMTTAELVQRSGLSTYDVAIISQLTTWDDVPFKKMRMFLFGCGLDFTDRKAMKRVDMYLKMKNRFTYLRKSPEFETVFKPLVLQLTKPNQTNQNL